jgi:hypothetical protein
MFTIGASSQDWEELEDIFNSGGVLARPADEGPEEEPPAVASPRRPLAAKSGGLPTPGIDARDHEGCTALMRATEQNDVTEMESLIRRGADVNLQDGKGETALHKAMYPYQEAAVWCLLAHDADVTYRDRAGRTALDAAWLTISTYSEVNGRASGPVYAELRQAFGESARRQSIGQFHEGLRKPVKPVARFQLKART